MSYMTVKFLDKEYSIPEDVLAYIELLEFTDSVQKQLANAFVRKLRNEIQKGNLGLLGDEDLTAEIEQQVGTFIAKLCDKGIFARTISDYLKDNKGYQLYSDVNKAALEKMRTLLIQEMDAWQAGYETAVNKAESHVTGMGFSIWSSSFVNHAIYAAMEASTLNKQGKEAEAQYQKDMNDLRSRLDSQYGGEKSRYINNTYIPNMEAALTVFAYELLDKYIADLIANGKFDSKTLDYVDISRSNDLLKNLTLSHNKTAILESAFAACPYNTAVYMQAMKYELLDYETFQTAKIFKQSHTILSFLKESWGEIAYPSKFRVNYYCINILAQFTDRTPEEILRGFAEPYVKGILKAYSRNADMISDSALCYKVLESIPEDTILAGEAISKSKATDYVNSTVSMDVYTQLVEKCGHFDLLARIKTCVPKEAVYASKEDIDEWYEDRLSEAFEMARQELAEKISVSRVAEAKKKAEQKKKEQERRKRIKIIKKLFGAAAILLIIIMIVAAVINKADNAKAYQEMSGEFCVYSVINDEGEEKDEFNWWLSIGEDGTMKMTSWSYAIDNCEVDSYSGTLKSRADFRKFEDYRIEDYNADVSEYEEALYCYKFHIADEWDEFDGYIICWQYQNGKAIDVYCDDYRYSFVEAGSDYSFKQWLDEINSDGLTGKVQNIIDNLDVSEDDAIERIEQQFNNRGYDAAVEAIVSSTLSDEQKNACYDALVDKIDFTSFEVNGLVFHIPEHWYIRDYSDPNISEGKYPEEDSLVFWYVKCMGTVEQVVRDGDDHWTRDDDYSPATIDGCAEAYIRRELSKKVDDEVYSVIDFYVECQGFVYKIQYFAYDERFFEPEMQMLMNNVDFTEHTENPSGTPDNTESEISNETTPVEDDGLDSLNEGKVAEIRGLSVYVSNDWRVYGQGSENVGRVSTLEGAEDHYWWIEYEGQYNETIFEELIQEKTSEQGKENICFTDYEEFSVSHCQNAYIYEMELDDTFIVDVYIICRGHVFNLIYESDTEKDNSAALSFIQNNIDFENFNFK